jgi:hypothetical protein
VARGYRAEAETMAGATAALPVELDQTVSADMIQKKCP